MSSKKRREKAEAETNIDMDMTPMIDIVFQMILFFIIITDFSQKEIALLQLPWSTVGIEDLGEDPTRLVINVTAPIPTGATLAQYSEKKRDQSDKIMVKGKYVGFRELFEILQQAGVQDERYREKDNPKLSSRSVLVRCDGAQAFDFVKGVLQVCASPEIAIYKIEIATAEKAADEAKKSDGEKK